MPTAERMKTHRLRWREKNPDKVREYNRRWAHGRPEREVTVAAKRCGSCGVTRAAAEFSRQRKAPDGLQAICKECAKERNRQRSTAASSKRWRERNPDRVRAQKRTHEARRRGARVDAPALIAEYEGVLHRDPCSYCGGPAGESDHIEPVVCGGEHGVDNLTSACKSCNSAKNAKPLLTFLLAVRHGH